MKLLLSIIIIFAQFVIIKNACSDIFYFNKNSNIIGASQTYKVGRSESLIEIARKFSLGYNEIIASNPDLDPFLTPFGATVRIPSTWILPELASYDGIVINLSEMRLYYFYKVGSKEFVRTFPIGIGREGYETPVGQFRIVQKVQNPSWYVPASIRAEKPELPAVVPPGPDNPLGTHALRLSLNSYLIHGTNKPWGVGRRVSHGCIRLYPEDIPVLFGLVKNGNKVEIVRQPVKIGFKDYKIFIEVHEDDLDNHFSEAFTLIKSKNLLHLVDKNKLYQALRQKSGEPVDISAN